MNVASTRGVMEGGGEDEVLIPRQQQQQQQQQQRRRQPHQDHRHNHHPHMDDDQQPSHQSLRCFTYVVVATLLLAVIIVATYLGVRILGHVVRETVVVNSDTDDGISTTSGRQQQQPQQLVVAVDQSTSTAKDSGTTTSTTTTTTPAFITYRPMCEYWNPVKQSLAAVVPLFREGIQTSMTQPSQQWSQLQCLSVHALAEENEDDEDGEKSPEFSLFGFGGSSSSSSSSKHNNNNNNKKDADEEPSSPPPTPSSPLLINNYQAPDAIVQVSFSQRVFGHRPPILGFGGAFTEASALNYQRLSEQGKEAVMELLFGQTGLGYTLGRIPINSCDFSIASYTFDDEVDDLELNHFDMGVQHDVQSGMVDMALRAASVLKHAWSPSELFTSSVVLMEDEEEQEEQGESVDEQKQQPQGGGGIGRQGGRVEDGNLLIMASPWSPPAWMKAPTDHDGIGAIHANSMTYSAQPVCLRDGVGPESAYAASWALYLSKFVTAYANLGLPLWAVTVQNEPEFPAPWEACSFTPETETDFVTHHLGPRLAQDHPDVKLFVFDHNKDHINTWSSTILNQTHGAREYVDGMAYHWYAGGMDRLLDGALGISNLHRLQESWQEDGLSSQQLLLGSESCHCPTTGYSGGDIRVAFARAERYVHSILADLAAGSNGWTEWNLLLDTIGGPNHLGNLCEAGLLAAPHRAKGASSTIPPLPPFEKNHPFGNVNIGDGRTREELDALGFPAEYLDLGVVVQPIYYYMGHISRYVRPGSYAVLGLITSSSSNYNNNKSSSGSENGGRIYRPRGTVVAGGGENDLARVGIEITLWPCEGSTRQKFDWDLEQSQHITVHGHDWLGRPTKSCMANEVDPDFGGLRLIDCEGANAGVFNVLPLSDNGDEEDSRQRYRVVLLNRPPSGSSGPATTPCLGIQPLANNGGAYGPRGGAQVVLKDCDADASTKWIIDANFGEASSTFLGSEEVCMTTGWPFLQMGAFVTPKRPPSQRGGGGGKPAANHTTTTTATTTTTMDEKTVILLNEANQPANFAIRNEGQLIMTASIPARSIQTFSFQ